MHCVIVGLCLALASPVNALCRQALALALDVSGSVDAQEYRLQLDGISDALLDPEVQAAFLSLPDAHVRLMIFEWSGFHHQREMIGWRDVLGPEDLLEIAQHLRTINPSPVGDSSTAIGSAMLYGASELLSQSECWRKTMDISGDGPANIGRHPRDIDPKELGDITINGLVIGPDGPANTSKNRHNVKSLLGYYTSYVVRGPGAFAEVAVEYEDFHHAIRRKLIRELQPAAVSMVSPNQNLRELR